MSHKKLMDTSHLLPTHGECESCGCEIELQYCCDGMGDCGCGGAPLNNLCDDCERLDIEENGIVL